MVILIENNEIKNYQYGLYLKNLYKGIKIYNNHIHNNTAHGIYINAVSHSTYASSAPLELVGNRLVDNNYGFYRIDTSSSL